MDRASLEQDRPLRRALPALVAAPLAALLLAAPALAEERSHDGFLIKDPIDVMPGTIAVNSRGQMIFADGLGLLCGDASIYARLDVDPNSPHAFAFGHAGRIGNFRPGTPYAYALASGYRAAGGGFTVLPGLGLYMARGPSAPGRSRDARSVRRS